MLGVNLGRCDAVHVKNFAAANYGASWKTAYIRVLFSRGGRVGRARPAKSLPVLGAAGGGRLFLLSAAPPHLPSLCLGVSPRLGRSSHMALGELQL